VQPEPTNRIGPSLQAAPSIAQQPLASFTRPLIKLVLGACFGIEALLLLLVPAVNSGVFWWAPILAGLACVVVAGVIARILALAIIAEPGQLVIRNFRNTPPDPVDRDRGHLRDAAAPAFCLRGESAVHPEA
jgi:hypothetical protein